ncbi:MAG: cupin domain-containing protein [Pseudomonadota bacterium]
MTDLKAQVRLGTQDLSGDIGFFNGQLGLRMDMIYPADDPRVAVFSGHGLLVRLEVGRAAGALLIEAAAPDEILAGARRVVSPGGTEVEIVPLNPPLAMPDTQHSFVVRRLTDQAPWVIGRAGMHYRDLIPDRLGGSIIASHIRIPDGGPVPDMVHYHTVGFQLIYCYRGWVDLVYEDQGEPFRLTAGSCVIQPPQIRHRVLYASDNIEVIEIGVPAEHVTTIDHDMTLPNGPSNPDRRFDGQRFVHHIAERATWAPHRLPGFAMRETGIAEGTAGVAGVQVARASAGTRANTTHDADIFFSFVLEGRMRLTAPDREPFTLEAGDAFVIPPDIAVQYDSLSDDLEVLEVSLPGVFQTRAVSGGDDGG